MPNKNVRHDYHEELELAFLRKPSFVRPFQSLDRRGPSNLVIGVHFPTQDERISSTSPYQLQIWGLESLVTAKHSAREQNIDP